MVLRFINKAVKYSNMKSTKSVLMLLLVLLYYVQVGNAQRTIVGKVTDCDGEPLQGAIIQIKGTNSGTLTDENGFYQIERALNEQCLVFSSFDLITQEIKVSEQDTINVTLKRDTAIYMTDEYSGSGSHVDKPAIYLYPEKQTEISLEMAYFDVPRIRFKPAGQVKLNSSGEIRSCRGYMKPFNPEKI